VPQIALFLFGSPRIERQGLPLEVDTRKALSLLAYLAVTGRLHNRDALATLLWPELDQVRARAALRRTLSTLRSAVGAVSLEISRETVGLKFDPDFWVDTATFQGHLTACQAHGHPPAEVCPRCLPELGAAVALYRGDFLAGFTLRDSLNFDDWQFTQGEQLRRQLAGALERLARGYSELGDFQTASEHARRWLGLDPLHEPAHRQLMQLYAWSGKREAALRQYQECMRILAEELGVTPLAETVRLYEQIKDHRLPAPPRRMVSTQVALPAGEVVQDGPFDQPLPIAAPQPRPEDYALPLVGRSAAWGALLQAYEDLAANGRPVGYFLAIEGEAGIGKTRLAEEFLAYAFAKGAIVVKATCYAGEAGLSYGLFVEGLRSAINVPTRSGWLEQVPIQWLAEAARLLPELLSLRPEIPAVAPLEGPGAQSRFFESIHRLLLAICNGPMPGVLFIDDLHWADTASLDLLTYLIRRARRQPLFILGTWREEEVGGIHRLRQLLGEAQRAGNASLVSLARLSRSDVRALVERLPGHNFNDRVAGRLYKETEGLPYFVNEYVSALLKAEPGEGEAGWSLPGGVRDLLQARLSGVSETGWQVLTTAAVIGRSFDYEILKDASGRSDEEAVAALEGLLALGLIREIGESDEENGLRYDFNHEKLRGLVYAQTNLARRRLLHRRVADALANQQRWRREPDRLAGQIARHYQLAGEASQAAGYFAAAGEFARSLYANLDALSHFQNALSLGYPDQAYLHEAIGDLQLLLGDYGNAITSYESAAAAGDQSRLANLAHKRGVVHGRLGDWEQANCHFQAALAALGPANDAQRSTIYADWSLAMHRQGQAERACELAEQALRLAEARGDERALAQAHNILGVLARAEDDLAQARQHLEISLQLAEKMENAEGRVAALNNLGLVYSQQKEGQRAVELLQEALSVCVAIGDRHREAALHSNLADLLYAAGNSEDAMTHLKRSVAIYAEIGRETGSWQPEIWKLVEW
jgi:DNA-binding SARP family transcriptional activator